VLGRIRDIQKTRSDGSFGVCRQIKRAMRRMKTEASSHSSAGPAGPASQYAASPTQASRPVYGGADGFSQVKTPTKATNNATRHRPLTIVLALTVSGFRAIMILREFSAGI
jgi:hypothetical protein